MEFVTCFFSKESLYENPSGSKPKRIGSFYDL